MRRIKLKRPSRRALFALSAALLLAAGWAFRAYRAGAFQVGLDPEEEIRTLPYVHWHADRRGETETVPVYRADRAHDGFNLFVPGGIRRADLVANDGTLVHRWRQPALAGLWHHVELTDRGLWVVVRDEGLALLDPASNVLEYHRFRAHHDFDVAQNGDVVALGRKTIRFDRDGRSLPALADFVAVIRDGRVTSEVDLFKILESHVPAAAFRRIAARVVALEDKGEPIGGSVLRNGTVFDLFHANSIQILNRRIAGVAEPGDWLLSVRQLDQIMVIDPVAESVRWCWGDGEIDDQHHATLLENGHILLFDNGLKKRRSRVVEIDPIRKAVVWEYPGSEDPPFYSIRQGGVQRLANGDTLIAITEEGRAIEVAPDGEIVWEFLHPDTDKRAKRRRGFYRMERYDPGAVPFDL